MNGITCGGGASVNTAIGCIPFGSQNALIGFFLKWGIGIGGGIAFLLILMAGFQIMTSRGDPKRLQAGQELMTSAISGLLLLIFSLVILRIIGFDIFSINAFK
jgi:Na+/melibiose symporter-like transporter